MTAPVRPVPRRRAPASRAAAGTVCVRVAQPGRREVLACGRRRRAHRVIAATIRSRAASAMRRRPSASPGRMVQEHHLTGRAGSPSRRRKLPKKLSPGWNATTVCVAALAVAQRHRLPASPASTAARRCGRGTARPRGRRGCALPGRLTARPSRSRAGISCRTRPAILAAALVVDGLGARGQPADHRPAGDLALGDEAHPLAVQGDDVDPAHVVTTLSPRPPWAGRCAAPASNTPAGRPTTTAPLVVSRLRPSRSAQRRRHQQQRDRQVDEDVPASTAVGRVTKQAHGSSGRCRRTRARYRAGPRPPTHGVRGAENGASIPSGGHRNAVGSVA